tara:strand:- start:16133 stop:16330 length:198 start_codon:yes stop_codon:yes gene_type:complete
LIYFTKSALILFKIFVDVKLCYKFAPLLEVMVHGVIGNTPVFGTVIQGSSPCGPTQILENPTLIK